MKRYYGYIRVSTAKQGTQGVSLIEQRAAIERHAARSGLCIVEWFEERETAAKRGRPVFSRMLGLLRSGRAHGVIIHKIDRSARNLKDWADLGDLIDVGVEVQFAADALDLRSRGGRLSADIQAVVAADFIRNLSEETKKGMRGRLRQGLYPLGAPVGYLDQGGGKAKIPDPIKAPLLQFAFAEYAKGQKSIECLCAELSRRGLKNRNGRALSVGSLAHILHNPFYTGAIRMRSGEVYRGVHQPLIEQHLFDQVQRVLSGKAVGKSIVHEFKFRRLFACRACGKAVTGELQKGHVYYRCHSKTCRGVSVSEGRIEGALLDLFGAMTIPANQTDSLIHDLVCAWEEENAIESARCAGLELQIQNVRARLTRLTDALIDGSIDKAAYDERKRQLDWDLRGLEEQLSPAFAVYKASIVQRAFELAKSLPQAYKMATGIERREILEFVTSNRWIDGKDVVVEPSEPFKTLAQHRSLRSGSLCRGKPRTGQ